MSTTIEIRVRYAECDPMGLAHHGAYPVWLEMARTELLREVGTAYGELEAHGVYFVVTALSVTYKRPARYDDRLAVAVFLERATRAKLEHGYEIRRAGTLLATARTTLACVDADGRPRAIPEGL